MKNEAYATNLDQYRSVETHQLIFYVNGDNVTYFDGFEVEWIPNKIKRFKSNKNITTNIYSV